MHVRRVLAGAALAVAVTGVAAPAWADSGSYPPTGPTTTPTTQVRAKNVPPSSLPFTGQEIAAMTVAGCVLLGGGVGVLLTARRRRTRSA